MFISLQGETSAQHLSYLISSYRGGEDRNFMDLFFIQVGNKNIEAMVHRKTFGLSGRTAASQAGPLRTPHLFSAQKLFQKRPIAN